MNNDMFEYGWSADTFREDFENNDTDMRAPDAGECARLNHWMYDYIDEHFFDITCRLLAEMRSQNEAIVANDPTGKSFVYLGYVFEPHRQLNGSESAFDYISRHTERTYLTNYLAADWCYEDFYAASPDKECDLFWCDGELWIPGGNCLFLWRGKA